MTAKGTKHFPRLGYNVSRGLREIVAPIQTMPKADWDALLGEFHGCCAFCGDGATRQNRGIVPDHLIPVTDYGELVLGNVVPACQTCNDSRGNSDWRQFIESRSPNEAPHRVARIEEHLARNPYDAIQPPEVLDAEELEQYESVLADWEELLESAKDLYEKVKERREIR